MSVLEKILEEIEEATFQEDAPVYVGDMEVDGYVRASRVKEIIRSYMDEAKNTNVPSNDGWIPVEDRLPEESGHYLVQLSRKLQNEDYSDRVVVLYNGEEKEFMCYASLIIAWQPLPTRYVPAVISKQAQDLRDREEFFQDDGGVMLHP